MGAVDDLYAYLVAEGLAGGSTGWPLYRRRMTDDPVPDQVVVVTENGGGVPELPSEVGIGDSALADPGVQVAVRGKAWDGDASASKAAEIFAALHGQFGVTMGSTTYLRVQAQTPEPLFIGFDARGRPQHTCSYLLLRAA